MKIIDRIRNSGPFYSLEFFPPRDRDQWSRFFQTAEKLRALDPLFISVTYGAGGNTRDNTLDITARFAREGYCPMAHLTCVGADSRSLAAYMRKLEDAGVRNVLALRGDPPKDGSLLKADPEFSYASDLVAFIHKNFPHFGVSVAGYPAPHAESPSFAADRRATADKLKAGGDFCITQLFFDPREYFEYVAQMRLIGVTQPVLPGVLPIQSMESLRRVLSLSACSLPAKFFLELEKADQQGGQAAVRELGLAYAARQIKALLDGGAPGIHLYTLNMADLCLRIVEMVRDLPA
jgi:methylenetetrahydrofolate reductase (NADPH)